MINVKDFGAKGDGLTDDTEAIQQAINQACLRGESITFPTLKSGEHPLVYLISGSLSFSGLRLGMADFKVENCTFRSGG